jgi:ketosteroid isomerase-like protein
MSQENVRTALEGFRRFQSGDPGWAEDWVHPDIEWDFSAYPLADLPTTGRGRLALLDLIRTYMSGWRDLRQEITEVIDTGDDILVVIHETVGLRDSDATLERDVSHLWTIERGQWTRWRNYQTRHEALEAAGLSEDDVHSSSS